MGGNCLISNSALRREAFTALRAGPRFYPVHARLLALGPVDGTPSPPEFPSTSMNASTPSRARRWLSAWLLLTALSHGADALAPANPAAVPRLLHPGAGQTFYFVLTDRFANGRRDNDQGGLSGGPDVTGFDPTRVSHYHGGDFAGLTARLDYLKAMGVTAVWVTPPFKNKPVQAGTASYHGYWITDFLTIDPHLGTDAEYREFIRQAHARGLRVYMDIIVNHTADVIHYTADDYTYRSLATSPYKDAEGRVFDERALAYNGLNDASDFPALSPAASFPFLPRVPVDEAEIKNPAWLNDLRYYHHRGNTTFQGENSVYGDFVGLDDLFTEHPRVVQGMIAIFSHWLRAYGVDGFRIDTAKHVNAEFWQAFMPAIRAEARRLGRPDFLAFGEVAQDPGDPAFLSEFSTAIPIDTTLDFGFFTAARAFVSKGGPSNALADFFDRDDYYTDHDSNVHATTTFLGNHDNGRFGFFLRRDNPNASATELAARVRLGHALLFLARGQPVVYYGDEQGMIGRGGNDMQARESMFASQAPDFATAPLLGTSRMGAEDKFDPQHPFYRTFAQLAALRAAHPALRGGALLPRLTNDSRVLAFSRIERTERVEYLAAFNHSPTESVTVTVPTSQAAGAVFRRLFALETDPHSPAGGAAADITAETLAIDAQGRATVTLAPLQAVVWRAETPLGNAFAPTLTLTLPNGAKPLTFSTRVVDGQVFVSRQEVRANVQGGDGFAEVTFLLERASRPGQQEYLGTDDAAPYRIFWRPPPDLAEDEALTFIAVVNDLRGNTSRAEVKDVRVDAAAPRAGTRGAQTPTLTAAPPDALTLPATGGETTLLVEATGTPPFEYQWLRNHEAIVGATEASLRVTEPGSYRVLVRNLAGSTLSRGTQVSRAGQGTIETYAPMTSRHVPARRVDVWLPPGYAAASATRYPVIYLHDGQSLFDPETSFGGIPWAVDQAMLRLIATGKTSGAILVCIWNTPARTAEYLPQKAVATADLAAIAGLVSRPPFPVHSDAYLRFLVEELKPFIDRTYRTQPDRDHTGIMGSSMGGLISAYSLVEYPEIFGAAACVSTHWPAGDGAVIDYLARRLPPPGNHRFYFDHGSATLDQHYAPFQQRMDAVLRRAGYAPGQLWTTRVFPGADHSERSWQARAEIPLAFLLGLPVAE